MSAQKLKVVIVDDERPARQRLQRLISAINILEFQADAANAEEALEIAKKHQPDIIFLDISMPGMNGIQLANKVGELHPNTKIIFTTAYDEYALEAFDVNATDYLLKPIRHERLLKAVKKLLPEPTQEAYYVHKEGSSILKIALSDIIFLQADQKYTEIHLADKTYLSSESLKEFEQSFPQAFLRIHRSTLINPDYLKCITQQQQSMLVELNATEIKPEVSRRHQAEVKSYLKR